MPRRLIGVAVLCLLAAGCAAWRTMAPLPAANSIVIGQLVVNCDFPLDRDNRLLAELVEMRGYVSAELAVPPVGEPVYIYLFQTPHTFQAFRRDRFPKLADRRAFFVETDSRLSVYAQWGDRLAEDLRHEVTHGYLHGVLPKIPLWVDEGLAEYFEVPQQLQGLNRPHVDLLLAQLQRGELRPDPRRLSRFNSAEQMQQADYAESWAWIHWLLHSTPENRALLQRYLVALKEQRNPAPLEDAILQQQPDAQRMLVEHVRWLGAQTGTAPGISEQGAPAPQ